MKIDRKPTPQDVTWFLDMFNTGRLDLEPSYQRKSVWNKKDREFFLDTIVNNYPCPPLFIHKNLDENGSANYKVIDGKQRLLTVIRYSKDEFSVSSDDETHPLAGKKFSEISGEFKKAFWNYTFPVELINEENKDVLKSIFDRLNRNNKALNPQELRKARYEGQLQKYIERESEDTYWSELVRFTKNEISRMADHQFICEIILVASDTKVHGFDQMELEECYAENDALFEKESIVKEIIDALKTYFRAINAHNNVLKDFFYTRTSVYILWAIFISHYRNLPETSQIATKLLSFAKELEEKGELSEDENIKEYATYNKGATTDRNPREKRVHGLKTYLGL